MRKSKRKRERARERERERQSERDRDRGKQRGGRDRGSTCAVADADIFTPPAYAFGWCVVFVCVWCGVSCVCVRVTLHTHIHYQDTNKRHPKETQKPLEE